jgi:hypothetical protein
MDVALFLEPLLLLTLMQREAERLRLCDWHLFFALISRGRRLSARNLGPASPVEASHPQIIQLYIISDMNHWHMLLIEKFVFRDGNENYLNHPLP